MITRARAPLRLGLAGGGTDVSPYCDHFGGCVMNVTIDKYAYATLSRSNSPTVRFQAVDLELQEEYPIGAPIDQGGPLALLKGVYERVARDHSSLLTEPLNLCTFSDAPPGSGLGSSSTLVVALVQVFAEHCSMPLGEYDVAHLAYEIERKDLGMAGGRQDQYASTFGGFNFMEFGSNDRVIVNPLRIKESVAAELEASLLLYYLGVSRLSSKIIDEQSKNVIAENQVSIDAMHRIREEANTMKEALLRGNIRAFAAAMQKGWESKKQMASGITNPEIDHIEELAFKHGACAAKISGAGGGGFMMFMCQPEDRYRLIRALEKQRGRIMDFHFSYHGARSWRVPEHD